MENNYDSMYQDPGNFDNSTNKTPVLLPILGALIGSIPGMLVWAIVGYLGYTAAIVGVLIALGAILGYEKMGGRVMSAAGVITCIIVLLIAVYCGAYLSWALQLHQAFKELSYDVTVLDCVVYLNDFIDAADMKSDFIGSLLLDYLFAGIGAFGYIRRKVRG